MTELSPITINNDKKHCYKWGTTARAVHLIQKKYGEKPHLI